MSCNLRGWMRWEQGGGNCTTCGFSHWCLPHNFYEANQGKANILPASNNTLVYWQIFTHSFAFPTVYCSRNCLTIFFYTIFFSLTFAPVYVHIILHLLITKLFKYQFATFSSDPVNSAFSPFISKYFTKEHHLITLPCL